MPLSVRVSARFLGTLALGLTVLLGAAPASAQTAEVEKETSFSVALNQDNFFGFYPTFAGTIPISSKVDFAVYGILWTRNGFSAAVTNNLWTEFGAGLRLRNASGTLAVKPQLGFTNGELLSGGAANGRATLLDGIVPSLTMNYADAKFESEIYAGYYATFRSKAPVTLDFLHYWGNAGIKTSKYVSFGGHWEHLRNTRVTGGEASNNYQWLGGYVQVALPKQNATVRFTGGTDVAEGADADFYKLGLSIGF